MKRPVSSGCTVMPTIHDQIETLRRFDRQQIRTKEIAGILGITEGALTMQRRRRTGVPAVVLEGCRPFYDRDEVIAWLEAQLGRNSRRVPSGLPRPSA
jgi:hypothetical protein